MNYISKKQHFFIFFITLLMLAQQIAHAEATEEIEVRSTTLQSYVKKAVENNAGLQSLFESYQAQQQRVRPARALPDPKLTYVHFVRSVETRVGPQEYKLGLVQSFPWFGTLSLQSKVAKDGVQSLLYQFQHQRLALIRDVKHTYYEAYFLHRSIDILNKNLSLLSNLERVTRSRYRTGIGQFSDVIRSQVELEKIKDRLRTTTDLKSPLIARFNALLNESPSYEFIWPESIFMPQENVELKNLKKIMEAFNPQLKALAVTVEQAQKNIQLARKNGMPSFQLGLDYIVTGESIVPTADSGKDPIAAMISLDIPLWRGKYQDQVRSAKSKKFSTQKFREEKLNELRSILSQVIYEYSDATRKITLYKDELLPKARQAFEATKRGYEAGKASFGDLIDSERMLLEFQLAHEQALTLANKAKASMEMLVGKTITKKEG